MAAEGKNRRPESANFRIWPGVTLIAVCGFLLFLTVYAVAYRSNLIPLPEYLKGLLAQEYAEETAAEIRTEETGTLLPSRAEAEKIYYDPAAQDPKKLLADLRAPEKYYQRIRLSYLYEKRSEEIAADIYGYGDAWKLTQYSKNGEKEQSYICDGGQLYRDTGNPMLPAEVLPVGGFTPQNLLGLPALSVLQTAESALITFLPDEKILHVTYEPEENVRCICRIALDTGLITDVQLQRNEQTVMIMYTERFDLAPADIGQAGFFTIPDIGGNDQ